MVFNGHSHSARIGVGVQTWTANAPVDERRLARAVIATQKHLRAAPHRLAHQCCVTTCTHTRALQHCSTDDTEQAPTVIFCLGGSSSLLTSPAILIKPKEARQSNHKVRCSTAPPASTSKK